MDYLAIVRARDTQIQDRVFYMLSDRDPDVRKQTWDHLTLPEQKNLRFRKKFLVDLNDASRIQLIILFLSSKRGTLNTL